MSETRSGIFTSKEFSYRKNVLKIAPDAFITINDSLTSRVVSPMQVSGTQDFNIRGGITSISVTSAVSPAGSSRASFEVMAPAYKGLHEDYYITLPNGVKVPIFTPMMEVKIYMKGRFLEIENNYVPQYYPVFWGMITGVQETYSGGTSSFSISCEDLLTWWKHQKINIQSSVVGASYGGTTMNRFPSVFQNMSAWEIIVALFSDTFFTQVDKDTGHQAFYNMVYPSASKNQGFSSTKNLKSTWGPFANDVIQYWNRRFGFDVLTKDKDNTYQQVVDSFSKIPLEMMGLQGGLDTTVIAGIAERVIQRSKAKGAVVVQTARNAKLDLDFNLLAIVQPYGAYNLFGDGAETQINSKLEIANNVCEKTNMEFFVDTNGSFVFKPPLYNLDVASGQVPYYRIGPEDIINYDTSFDSNSIVNYLVVTGPQWQELDLEAIGLHADFESIKRFGIRSEQMTIPYGQNADQLKMIAVAEMTRRNGQAFSANLSVPLRPEMRLGYPVYLPHLDTYYYVTGISHSLEFGSSAQTNISLQFKRDRIFEDGTSGLPDTKLWDVLSGCVMREAAKELRDPKYLESLKQKMSPEVYKQYIRDHFKMDVSSADSATIMNDIAKENGRREVNLFSGPGMLGYWKLDRAAMVKSADAITEKQTPNAVLSNELVMITKDSVPYTDKNGYRHIGAFPFGANLVLMKNGKMWDNSDYVQKQAAATQAQVSSTGIPSVTNDASSNSTAQGGGVSNVTTGTTGEPNETKETTVERTKNQIQAAKDSEEAGTMTPDNLQKIYRNREDGYYNNASLAGINSAQADASAARIQIDAGNAMAAIKSTSQPTPQSIFSPNTL
jgi:hypothetical protein